MIIDFDSKNKGGGKEPVVEVLNVTANGSYNAPSGVDGFNPVEVNVPQKTFNKTSLTKEYTANGQYSIATPDGYDGISDVNLTVAVPERQPVLESLSVTDNGTYTPESGVDGYNSVDVNVPKEIHNVTSKSITANGTYNSEGNDVWNEVSVNVPQREPVLDTLNVTSNGTYNAPSNIDGYNTVSVNVPQSGGGVFDFKQLNGVSLNTKGATLDLTGLDTSTFTSMYRMFSDCYNLTSLDVSHFDTSNVTNMNSMFNNCNNLTSLDLSNFDTSKVENMSSMFNYCSKITSLDLSHFNTSNVTDMGQMFWNCSEITSLNISNWDASNVTSIWLMFDSLYSLETINCDGLKLPNINLSSIGLNSSPLTVDSIVGLLNALPQSTNNYSFQIGQTNINKLSEEQKSIATGKGWALI